MGRTDGLRSEFFCTADDFQLLWCRDELLDHVLKDSECWHTCAKGPVVARVQAMSPTAGEADF